MPDSGRSAASTDGLAHGGARRHPAEGSGVPRVLLALLLGYAAYAALFIYRTSFVVGGTRYFSLFDDAMISMRYARNLAEGHGLVWNAGAERVEGITNPLWTVYMAGVHLLPVSEAKLALVVQATSAALLLVNLVLVWYLALRVGDGSRHAAAAAVAFTAFYGPLNNWALQGLEVGALAAITSGAVLLALRARDEGRASAGPYLLLGAATLVRPDAVVALLTLTLLLALLDPPRRRRHLWMGIGTLVAAVALQTAARVLYYGDPLPNTYYLKMTGYPLVLRLTQGLAVLGRAVWYANPLVVLIPVLLLWRRRHRSHLLLAGMVAGQVAYSVWVGGDAWEWWGGANRYIAVAVPLFFVLLAVGLRLAYERAAADGWFPARAGRAVWIGTVVLAILFLNARRGPGSLLEWALVRRPMLAAQNERMVRVGLWLRRNAAPDAVIAVYWAGTTPYFSHLRSIDLHGKSDRHVARVPMIEQRTGLRRAVGFFPGHMKWDYEHSVRRARPDLIVTLGHHGYLRPFLGEYRQVLPGPIYLRRDSRALPRMPDCRTPSCEDRAETLEPTPEGA